MLHTFVDESGSKDVYYIASLTIESGSEAALNDELEFLQQELMQVHQIPWELEFHGYEMWQGESLWACKAMEDRKNIFERTLDLILSQNLKIAIKGIERANFERRYGKERRVLHNAALIWNLEKVQKYAAYRKKEFIIIADQSGPMDDYYHDQIEMFHVFETLGWDPVVLSNLNSHPIFVDSLSNYGLQAIDVVAYVYMRGQLFVNNKLLEQFQKILLQKLYSSGKILYLRTW